MTLQALIFDVDGTLADTEEAHRCAFNDAFHEHGLDWHWNKTTYARLLSVTGGKERIGAHIGSLPLDPHDRAALAARIPAIHGTKTGHYLRLVASGVVPLRAGVERLLDEAQAAGVALAIASTTTFANIESLLETDLGPGTLKRFTVIGAGDQVRQKKPAPDIYEWVLRELGQPAQACVAIEDSNGGLQAAKAAGLFTVVTPCYWTRGQDFSAADWVIPGLGSTAEPFDARLTSEVANATVSIREIDRRLGLQAAPVRRDLQASG